MSGTEEGKLFGMEPEKGRWILVILGMIINLCLGSIYSWSVFVGPLTTYFTKDLGQSVSASEILLPFSVFLAFFAIAMPFTGKYIEKYGPRNITIIGGCLTGLGWLLSSLAGSVQWLYLFYGVIAGVGVGVAYGVPVAVAARWFPDRRGLAVGLTLLGFGFSAVITANIAGFLIGATGVMGAFRMFGIAFIVLIVVLALPLKFPATGWKPAGWTPPAPAPWSNSNLRIQTRADAENFHILRTLGMFLHRLPGRPHGDWHRKTCWCRCRCGSRACHDACWCLCYLQRLWAPGLWRPY